MINQFNNIELYRHYLFFEYLKKKFPPDGVEKIDVSDLVDLESLNLDVKGKVSISLEEENTILDPNNPRIIYASTWKVKRTPYSLESGGPGSGLWKSTDGGDSWEEVTRKKGLPEG